MRTNEENARCKFGRMLVCTIVGGLVWARMEAQVCAFLYLLCVDSVMFLVCPHAQLSTHSGAAPLPCQPASLNRKDIPLFVGVVCSPHPSSPLGECRWHSPRGGFGLVPLSPIWRWT